MALIDDFKARFPEFTDAVVDQYIPILEPVWPCYYNKTYENCNQEAILNLVAHLLVMEVRNGAASIQNVASKSVGSVSTSFQASTASQGQMTDLYNSTKYGQRFLLLIGRNYGGIAV